MYQGGCGVPTFYTPGQSVRVGTPPRLETLSKKFTVILKKKIHRGRTLVVERESTPHRPAHEAGQAGEKTEGAGGRRREDDVLL